MVDYKILHPPPQLKYPLSNIQKHFRPFLNSVKNFVSTAEITVQSKQFMIAKKPKKKTLHESVAFALMHC